MGMRPQHEIEVAIRGFTSDIEERASGFRGARCDTLLNEDERAVSVLMVEAGLRLVERFLFCLGLHGQELRRVAVHDLADVAPAVRFERRATDRIPSAARC